MMDYKEFKTHLVERLIDFLPQEYKEYRLNVQSMIKVNAVKDGISLLPEEREMKGTAIGPTIYANDFYTSYIETDDFDLVLKMAADCLVKGMDTISEIGNQMDCSDITSRIVFQLVNTEQNQIMLADMPHRELHDLSIVYRWVLNPDENNIKSALIRNGMAEQLSLSEEQLFALALENTRRLFPPVVKSIDDVIGMVIEDPEAGDEELTENPMWIISNSKSLHGAGTMLYKDVLHSLAERIGSDLYILPSSVHEVMAVPVYTGNPDEYSEMVTEINMTHVELEERLSNQVYCYERASGELSQATDNKTSLSEDYFDEGVLTA